MNHEVIQKVQNFHLSVSLAFERFGAPSATEFCEGQAECRPGFILFGWSVCYAL